MSTLSTVPRPPSEGTCKDSPCTVRGPTTTHPHLGTSDPSSVSLLSGVVVHPFFRDPVSVQSSPSARPEGGSRRGGGSGRDGWKDLRDTGPDPVSPGSDRRGPTGSWTCSCPEGSDPSPLPHVRSSEASTPSTPEEPLESRPGGSPFLPTFILYLVSHSIYSTTLILTPSLIPSLAFSTVPLIVSIIFNSNLSWCLLTSRFV